MQPVELILELRKLFSTTNAQRVIPALKRDPIIWTSLQDDIFLQKSSGICRWRSRILEPGISGAFDV